MSDNKYKWFNDDVKKLSKNIWFPTQDDVKNVIMKRLKLNDIQSEHLFKENIDISNFKFSELNFDNERKKELIGLKNDFDFLMLINEEKIKFLTNPSKYNQDIKKFIDKNSNLKEKNDDIINKLKLYNRMTKEIKKINSTIESKKIKSSDMIKKINIATKTAKTEFDKKNKLINNCQRALSIKLVFDKKQKIILKKWFKISEDLYNFCVFLYDSYLFSFPELIGDINSFPLNFIQLKPVIFNAFFANINEKGAPFDVLAYEIKNFLENLDSCKTNLKNGNIKHFNIGPKNTKNKQTITIPKNSIGNKGIFANLLKKQSYNSNKLKNYEILCDAKLTYDRILKKYTLYFPQYREIKKKNNRKPVVALDPGEAIFMSYYALDRCGKIGMNMRSKIRKYQDEIRKWQRKMTMQEKNKKTRKDKIYTKISKKERKILKANKKKRKEGVNVQKSKLEIKLAKERKNNFVPRKQIKKIIRRLYNKIKNMVNELHKKTAIFLCKTFDRILIPEFNTSQMVLKKYNYNASHYKEMKQKLKELYDNKEISDKEKIEARKEIYKKFYLKENEGKSGEEIKKEMQVFKKRGRLNKNIKFTLQMLSHYKFRQYLLAKAKEYDCQVVVVTEEYTSQACTKCGALSQNYTKEREKKCSTCKYRIHRDINGARNILLKNMNLIISKS